MNPDQKLWNQQLQGLRRALSRPEGYQEAIELFLSQHAMVHSAKMARSKLWSFEDEVFQNMTEDAIRCIPPNCEHSVAWCIWHIARIEDVTMNLLVAGSPQVAQRDNWLERIKVSVRDTGNTMDKVGVANLSATIDVKALRAYRVAVGRRTREIVQRLEPADLKRKIAPVRLQEVLKEGAVVEAARDLIDYWGNRTVAGLLMMPATRHNFVHLNEALRVKNKCR